MLSLSLVALALQAAQPTPGPPSALDLLAGEWVCRAERMASGQVWRSESWRREDDGRLTGTIRAAPAPTTPRRSGCGRRGAWRPHRARGGRATRGRGAPPAAKLPPAGAPAAGAGVGGG